MVESEEEMVRERKERESAQEERFTSLQATYKDSVPPSGDDWEYDE